MPEGDRRTVSPLERVERWLKCSVLPPVGTALIRGIGRSMRLQTRGHEAADALHREGRHMIVAFWHAQQLMMPFAYHGPGGYVLISQHRDGEIISRIIGRFGYGTVRGSSTRGGAKALRTLIKLGRSGNDLCVTPDGPKGPRQVAKLGVIQLAKATGLPLVPVAFACSKKKCSRAGITLWSPIPSHEGCFCMGRRSGSRVKPMRPRSRRSAWNSKPS